MKLIRISFLYLLTFIIIIPSLGSCKKIDTIHSKEVTDIDLYQKEPPWYWFLTQIGKPFASSTLKPEGNNNYDIKNINDYNINTAWVEGAKDFGIGESISFLIIKRPDYKFNGQCYLLNGYYKNEKTWSDNSRVKELKLFYNKTELCVINLLDICNLQVFDISRFFNFNENDISDKITLKDGDLIRFEISKIYQGKKFKDTAITEFLCGSFAP